MTGPTPYLNSRLQDFTSTIFVEMSELALATGAVNLGQGFPDTDGPAEILETAVQAIRDGDNQYPPGPGSAQLRQAIAEHQQRFYGLDYDPATEVLVTAGATEAIAAAILALCETGDEVVGFDPAYDSYAPCIAMAGAHRRLVTLRAPDYHFDPDELRAAITDRTRLLLLNSPHNPTGKVFNAAEQQLIAELAIERDLVVVTDEVYEHMTYDGVRHVPLATLPGMRERTVTISSAGKTFSVTGWKIGWVCAPAALITAVRTAKQFLTFTGGAPFQPAVAVGLGLADDFYADLRDTLQAKRDRLAAGLNEAGLEVFVPAGTYFVTADVRPLGYDDGVAFCRELPHRSGVVGVPNVVFYDDKPAGATLVRFAFCKRDEVLDEAIGRLQGLRR